MSTQSCDASLKRKHKTLTIKEKVHVLELLQAGTPVKRLCNIYNIGSSTVYDIRRKKDALLQYYSERQSKKGAVLGKTMKEGKCNVVEKALVEWFEERKNEGVTVTGGMLIDQAKIFQKKLNPAIELKYSQGWLGKFKNRHGIRLYDEKKTTDSEPSFTFSDSTDFTEDNFFNPLNSEAVIKFKKMFSDTVSDEALHLEQIYSASETTVHWRQMPKDIFAYEQDNERGKSEEQIAVFSCFNAAGSHRCKLLVVSDNPKPKALNGVKVLPIIYRSNEKNSITRDIMIDWLENHFTTEARTHCTNLGFSENCKLLLILDSILAPSNEEVLAIDNVIIIFVPSGYSIYIQPQELGISRWLKCWYRLECMADFLEGIIQGKSSETFKNEFDIKASIWALARSWESISEKSFKRSWHKLWTELSDDDLSETDVAETYAGYKQQILNPIVDYVKSVNINLTKYICHENLEEWIESGDVDPFEEFQSDKINNRVKIKEENDNEICEQENISSSIENCVRLTSELISGLEKQDCMTEQEIMYLYRLKANLVAEKLKKRKCAAKDDSRCALMKKKIPQLKNAEN